jgi:hypothetical protein
MWKWQPIRSSCEQMKWTITPTAAWRKHAAMFGYNFCPWSQAVPLLGKCSTHECDWWLQGFASSRLVPDKQRSRRCESVRKHFSANPTYRALWSIWEITIILFRGRASNIQQLRRTFAVIESVLFPGFLVEDISTTGAMIRTLRAAFVTGTHVRDSAKLRASTPGGNSRARVDHPHP